jgi:phage tail-like protein
MIMTSLIAAGPAFLMPRYSAWRFQVWVNMYDIVDGIQYGEFTECSGLSMQRESKAFTEGGLNDRAHQLPGRITYTNITLKRGMINKSLWKWFVKGSESGLPDLREVYIALANASGIPTMAWSVKGAYPVKWSGPSLNTGSNEFAMEEIELAHHGIEIESLF